MGYALGCHCPEHLRVHAALRRITSILYLARRAQFAHLALSLADRDSVCRLTHARFNSGKHDMEKFTIKRDGLPPIAFNGEVLAKADNTTQNGNRANRWIEVTIFRTQGGKYVASLDRYTRSEGESDRRAAVSRENAAGIIEWLKEDGDELGSVSQEAVEMAAKADPAFSAAWVEVVE